jgi:AraC-like DNA-binding protein
MAAGNIVGLSMAAQSNNTYRRLSILDGVEILHAKKHAANFPFHSHQTFNITLVLDQVFSTRLSGHLLHALPGAIVITNPDEVHATICESRIGSSFFTFYISPAVIEHLNFDKPVFFDNKVIYDLDLFKKLNLLSLHLDDSNPDFEKHLLASVHELVIKYANDYAISEQQGVCFQEFLKQDILTRFSLERSAALFGLDKYKFLRLFRQQTGLTPNNYVILKRIEQSKTMLHTGADLLDIALETGFYDATHFCRHFKKFTGITPNIYRHA